MIRVHDEYEIDDARQRFDLLRVQQWMATTYWWGSTATAQAVTRTFDNSMLVVGAYHSGEQVGCCRVVTGETGKEPAHGHHQHDHRSQRRRP